MSPILSDVLTSFITVGLPVIVIFGWLGYKSWARHRESQTRLELELLRERTALANAQDERLVQRVAVLERIVTDRSALLGDEIERLRDTPLN